MLNVMTIGSGRYIQGENALGILGEELAAAGCTNIFVIGGRNALAATFIEIEKSLTDSGVKYLLYEFTHFGTYELADRLASEVKGSGKDAVVGIGGGRAIDISKAVAARAGVPVFCVPTSAATCAAWAPLSVMYDDTGCQKGIEFHKQGVNGALVDLKVMANAPERLLAAGMADSMAKMCELSSMRPSVNYGDIGTGKYCGYVMACLNNEMVFTTGRKAYESVKNKNVTPELSDAVFASIALTGISSAFAGFDGRDGSRFAIAHSFNEILRGEFIHLGCNFLHGEIVAVGIIAQLSYNGRQDNYAEMTTEFFKELGLPTTLCELGLDIEGPEYGRFLDNIFRKIKTDDKNRKAVIEAIDAVR